MGGVFRDAGARKLYGFSIVFCNEAIFRIEACVILKGLHIEWEKRFRKIELKCDNAFLVETLLAGGVVYSSLVELRLINYFFIRNWNIRLRYVQMSQNVTADQMTN